MAEKHRIAVDLLGRLSAVGRGLLPLQALTEFYAVAVRNSTCRLSGRVSLRRHVGRCLPIREAVFADVVDAMRVHREHGIQFWDGMMWSVTKRAGARFLLSEDLQDGHELEGVRFSISLAPTNVPVLENALRL